MFGICVYADRERWVSALEPLLYPTGVSFYRPFSCRAEYFVPGQLAEQLSDKAQCQSLLSQATWNEGFVGIRFRDEAAPDYLSRFIPLRKIRLDDVEVSDGINLRFTLDGYVVPQFGNGEVRTLPSLDIRRLLPNLTETKLFIHFTEMERVAASQWAIEERFPEPLWDALLRALSPTALGLFRNTVVMRLSHIHQRGSVQELLPRIVDQRYKARGYKLWELTTYDLVLSYNRLVQREIEAPPLEHQFCLTNPADEFQVSRRRIHILGNYRSEKIWVSPLKPGQGPVKLAVEPAKLGQPDVVVDQTAAKMVGLKVPVSIRSRKWPAVRKLNLSLFLVTLTASGVLFWWYLHAPESVQKAILVFVAALFAVSINALKDVLVVKK